MVSWLSKCILSNTELQEGLAVVKVTIAHPRELVFLSCVSPKPIPYEHVQKGMKHREYLEIDPRFGAELGISQDTVVCCSLVLGEFFFFLNVLAIKLI